LPNKFDKERMLHQYLIFAAGVIPLFCLVDQKK
jgi:hypothetical protein